MIEALFLQLQAFDQVEAIALGGSRAGVVHDEKSDYDVYVYCTAPIPEAARAELLRTYCSQTEIGNHYWEPEDNCTLKNGVDLDIIYRNLDDFCNDVAAVVERYEAKNGYTTCMWHNLLSCKIVYDRHKKLSAAKERFSVPYPAQLQKNIITRNMHLLSDALPAYSHQIEKAVLRNDSVSIIHRTAAFLESYFDILFALNKMTHPGEKRLISLCENQCKTLPAHFSENMNALFADVPHNGKLIVQDISAIIGELKKVIMQA